MLHYIKGNITMKFNGGVVAECGGLGYEIHTPDNSALYLKEAGEEVLIFTEMIVREDDVSLCGFADRESLELFRRLRTVNGVGAKAALAILSVMPLPELKKAIILEDVAVLTRANGVGKKIAQRVVLELKEKIDDIALGSSISAAEAVSLQQDERGEAVEAMMELGYSRSEAADLIAAVGEDGLSTEEYIRKALRGAAR